MKHTQGYYPQGDGTAYSGVESSERIDGIVEGIPERLQRLAREKEEAKKPKNYGVYFKHILVKNYHTGQSAIFPRIELANKFAQEMNSAFDGGGFFVAEYIKKKKGDNNGK